LRYANPHIDRLVNPETSREERWSYRAGALVGRMTGIHALMRWLAKYDPER
jgi:hypothetical protein